MTRQLPADDTKRWRPDPDDQAECSGDLARGQVREEFHRNANRLVNAIHDFRIVPDLHQGGKRRHQGEEHGHDNKRRCHAIRPGETRM